MSYLMLSRKFIAKQWATGVEESQEGLQSIKG